MAEKGLASGVTNRQELATYVTLQEGGKQNLTVAQVAEVIKIVREWMLGDVHGRLEILVGPIVICDNDTGLDMTDRCAITNK